MRTSYSALSTYSDCPRKYKFERVDNIVLSYLKTPFILGTALDEASEAIFSKYMKEPKTTEDARCIFRDQMLKYELNGVMIDIPKSHLVTYSNTDLQFELLKDVDKQKICEYSASLGIDLNHENIMDFVDECRGFRKKKQKFEINTQKLYNFIHWNGLFRKGSLMLDALETWAKERIGEVISIQKEIRIDSSDGEDYIVGYIDLEAILKGEKHVRTIDLKTSSNTVKYYPDGVADDSPQIVIYCEATDNDKSGYVVIDKKIRKTEGKARIKEILGTVTNDTKDKLFDKIEDIIEDIKAEKFPKNKDSCFSYGPCEFMGLCNNDCMEGLTIYDRHASKGDKK